MLYQKKLSGLDESTLILDWFYLGDLSFLCEHGLRVCHTDYGLRLFWFFSQISVSFSEPRLPHFDRRLVLNCEAEASECGWNPSTVVNRDFCAHYFKVVT